MFVTTTLIFVQIPYVKHRSWFLAFAWILFFGFIDALFWGAALRKVPLGAWVPLLVGFVVYVLFLTSVYPNLINVLRTTFMVFWTWAKGLEDEFDGANRRNLRHFISKVISEKPTSGAALTQRPLASRTVGFEEEDTGVDKVSEATPVVTEDQELTETVQLFLDVGGQEKVPLPRMSTMAVFHKLSSGKGVPHTFYGFLKQWPALPRVVVFLSVRIMPMAHVDKEEQYRINKVRTLPG
jgi:KUP system potassium uptake protein